MLSTGCGTVDSHNGEQPSVQIQNDSGNVKSSAENRPDEAPAAPAPEKGSEANVESKPESNSPAKNEITFPDLTKEYGGNDPIEGVNRSFFVFNKYANKYFMQPIVILWGSLIPRHGVECLNRLTDNLAFPKRTFSSLLQAKFKYAGIDFSRFLINITLGVAGFYDPALNWFDMEVQDEDFGQAFAVWGIGPGAILHIPLIGPSNVRDGIGQIFDYAFDPKSYITGGQAFTMLNQGTTRYRGYDSFIRAHNDPYELLKMLYAAERFVKINDYDRKVPFQEYERKLMADEKDNTVPAPNEDPILDSVAVLGFKTQGPSIDTLRIGMFKIQNDYQSMWVDKSLWNTDFYNMGSIRSVEVVTDKSEMPYKVWYQKSEKAPLAVIIPGFGTHYSATEVTAMAEIFFNHGCTVAVLSSVMNWEFMATAASVPVPGYTPVDADDVRNAAAAVVADLEENRELKFSGKILVGYSLGGLHTLFIGAKEQNDPKLKFDRYVAINPPVDLLYSLKRIDEYGTAWKKWPGDKIFERGVMTASKYLTMCKEFHKPYEEPSPRTAHLSGGDKGTATDSEDNATSQSEKKSNKTEDASASSPIEYGIVPTEDITWKTDLPFTDTEAQMLIAYNFKVMMNEVMLSIARSDNPLSNISGKCTWGNRVNFYREINKLNFNGYANKYLVKYYSDRENKPVTIEEINEKAGLRAIQDFLHDGKNVFVIHSSNDFLESGADRRWLKETMGDRCVFYNVGGHLGNLPIKKLHDYLGDLSKSMEK